MIPVPTKEEIEFLGNIKIRRQVLKGAPLIITGRLFGKDLRLDSFELENTHFVDCDFVACTMLGGVLKGVHFTNCLFVANLWDEGQWDDVVFTGCAWRGRFNMGPSLGAKSVKFDDCEFIGSTSEEMGYGGPADYFGIIGGTNGDVLYQKCKFEHTYINGGATLKIISCTLNESVLVAKDNSLLLIEDVTADGLIRVGLGRGDFSSVTVRKSKFARALIFEGAKIGVGIFEDLVADLNLNIVKARSIDLRRVTFLSPVKENPQYQYGLNMESAKIGTLNITDCTFQGNSAALYLLGEEQKMRPVKIGAVDVNKINNYSTDVENMSIKNTPVNRGRFEYMNIGNLLMEDLRVVDADFSNSKIGKFTLRNVSMTGKVEFANTTIVHKVEERVTDTSTGTRPTITN